MSYLKKNYTLPILALLLATILISRPAFSQTEAIQENTEARQALEAELQSIENQIADLEKQLTDRKSVV